MNLLETRDLSKRFGGVIALNNINLMIEEGQLVGLIGPNGSGKTTLFDCLTGFLAPDAGKVLTYGEDITHKNPHTIALKGIVRTFQSARVFLRLTILDNMKLAIQQHSNRISGGNSTKSEWRSFEQRAHERMLELLELFDLQAYLHEQAKNLSYGQRKLLTVAMALMPDPVIVLLDEPTAAVNPVLINRMKSAILSLNEQGQSFLIIEHKVDFLADICNKIFVLDHGEKIADGRPQAIVKDERVIDAYFGG